MVAAACLDSSLRWFSIFSTFASSSALMYSVSGGGNWACVGWMAPSGCPEAAEWCTGAAAAHKDQPGQGAMGTGQGTGYIHPHPKSYCWGGGGGHRHVSPGLKGLGRCRGHGHQQPHSSLPSCGWVVSTAQLPVQGQHLQVCREKWRLSVAGAAAARAEGSAWPSRYWMERSWKQGSASSTAVARSVLPRDTDLREQTPHPVLPHQHPQLVSPQSRGTCLNAVKEQQSSSSSSSATPTQRLRGSMWCFRTC